MSLQNPFLRTTPAASTAAPPPPASSPPAALVSFVDIDGFPAAASFASSPSHSTATTSINVEKSSDVRKLDQSSAVKMDANGWNAMPAARVDWPEESDGAPPAQPTLFDMKKHQQPQIQTSSSRDQQIFRRKLSRSGSGSAPSYTGSRGSGEEKRSPNGGGRGGIIFESFEASNNNSSSPSRGIAGGSGNFGSGTAAASNQSQRSASLLDNIAEAARHSASNPPQPQHVSSNRTAPSRSPSSAPKMSLQSPPPEPTASASISPQEVLRKTGVLNKVASIFGNKQQQQNGRQGSPASKLEAANNGLQQLKQTITAGVQSAGVQFRVPAGQSSYNQVTPASSSPARESTPQSHNHPAISPSRSNAQSSVTGYSGDSSSYNPTGWPGTVDKRGRTYAMEPSYSESEGESLSSPQRRSRAGAGGRQHSQPTDQAYPVQNYRGSSEAKQQVVEGASSFGGGASAMAGAAELEDWLKGDDVDDDYTDFGDQSHVGNVDQKSGPIDLDSCYSASQRNRAVESKRSDERKSGPVDLDEVYERRLDGWREGRGESLANISEARTAADVQLEAALGLANNSRHSLNQSMGSNSGRGPRSHTESPNTSLLAEDAKLQGIDLSGSQERIRAWGRPLPAPKFYSDEVDFDHSATQRHSQNSNSYQRQRMQQQHHRTEDLQTLSEEALRWKDAHSAQPRPGGGMNFRGYRGFLNKTEDVPNLMDDLESEANTSLGTGVYTTDTRRQHGKMGLALPAAGTRNRVGVGRPASLVSSSNIDSGSDVFDGVQEEQPFGPMEKDILNVNAEDIPQQRVPWKKDANQFMEDDFSQFEAENMPYSTRFNPFTANGRGETTDDAFLDPSLNISAVSRGSAGAFSHQLDGMDEMEDDFESLPDLSMYAVDPEMVRQMVRAFRKICTNQMEISSSEETMLHDFENLVDTKKAFALFEMRSRIMETDIDRGLERRGGTNIVDDIVTTSYFQAAARVRDAVIVSKAWRDGATPKDVITAHLLTRRSSKAHFVQRPIHRLRRPGKPIHNRGPQYWQEEVKWLDDTDFMLMRCQSLGAGTMKGFEMFTIGDCQSALLKMTSDNCTQLRRELRSAMMSQIEAEELMQEEIDLDGDENIVAEAEQLYRDATVDVKTLSIKLVLADKAFALVRSRMEQLVSTIESLLNSIETGEEDAESLHSGDDDDGDGSSYASHESQEDKVKLAARAKKAELSAEVAVREALLAKQEAEQIRSDKQREIDSLKKRLEDMETKSQLMASEHRMAYLNKARAKNSFDKWEAKSFLESTFDGDAEGAAKKDRLKQKFRDRRLSKPKEEHGQPEREEWLA